MYYSIAIDGPAGAGKSTIAKAAARQLDYIYVDTGAMYRAMALYFLRKGIDGHDTARIAKECPSIRIALDYDDEGRQQVYLNEENVTPLLRSEEVGQMASTTSAIPAVREALLDLQRNMALEANVLMDGRDIGTHVLPDATLKIFLTASPSVRADRRYKELLETGPEDEIDRDKIERDIIARDKQDTERALNPLRQAEDAVVIDSSDLSVEEVIKTVVAALKEAVKTE